MNDTDKKPAIAILLVGILLIVAVPLVVAQDESFSGNLNERMPDGVFREGVVFSDVMFMSIGVFLGAGGVVWYSQIKHLTAKLRLAELKASEPEEVNIEEACKAINDSTEVEVDG